MDEATALGLRIREVRHWRKLSLREAAGLAGLSFSFWGEIERGEKPVATRRTLEAIAGALRVHPAELTGQPWTPQDPPGSGTPAGLVGIEIALERYQLGSDPGLPVRDWPQITEDLQPLVTTLHWTGDYTAMAELAPALLGELHGAYVRLPQQRPEVLVGLMRAYASAMWTAKRLGGRGLPSLAARAAQQCAQTLGDPVWLGYAAYLRGDATGRLDRVEQYERSVAAAEALTSRLDSRDALQACGMLHLSAALAAGAQADPDTAATHLVEASALAARMETEVGTWAHLWFGNTTIGIRETGIAVELREYGQALKAAKTVHPELLPAAVMQAGFWAEVGRALAAEKKPGSRACGCWCTPRSWLRSASAMTCSSAKPSPTCCARPGVMRGVGSCAAWPGAWESHRSSEPDCCAPRAHKGERTVAEFSLRCSCAASAALARSAALPCARGTSGGISSCWRRQPW